MRASDEAITQLCQSLTDEISDPEGFEIALGELIGKHRRMKAKADRHGEVLAMVDRCNGQVVTAGHRLGVTSRAVYHHLEKKLKADA